MKSDLAVFKKIILPVFRACQRIVVRLKSRIEVFFEWLYYKRSPYYRAKKINFRNLIFGKGRYGEYLLCYRLRGIKGKWLFNLYIPTKHEWTEIDAVFICDRGIFLFESKNFTGRIYGKDLQKEWFQTVLTEKGLRKSRFFNPIMQNSAHKNALVKCIGNDLPIYPMVVFGKRSKLYTPLASERPQEIFTISKLRKRVKSHARGALSSAQIDMIYRQLFVFQESSKEKRLEHIHHIQTKH